MRLSRLIQEFDLRPHSTFEDAEIRGVAALDQAQEGDLSFLANPKYASDLLKTRATAVLVSEPREGVSAVQLVTPKPYLTWARILNLLYPDPPYPAGIHTTAVVDPSAAIHPGAFVGPFCNVEADVEIGAQTVLMSHAFVGRGARLGEACRIFPGVVIYPGVRLGSRVRIHAHSTLGSDGFGYAQDGPEHVKIPQLGQVLLDDDVEVGANVAVDRGALKPTRIGRGTKVDNLVQVAHGVEVGEDSLLISQSGISGSAKLGNRTILAGQVGVIGHVVIGDDVLVMGKSVVTKNLTRPGRYAGNPAVPHMQYQRQLALQRSIADLKQRIQALEALAQSPGGE